MMDLQRLTKSVEQLQNFLAFLDCSLPHELCLGSIPDIWCHIRSTLLYTTLTLLRKINLVGNTSSSSRQVDIQIFIKFSSHVAHSHSASHPPTQSIPNILIFGVFSESFSWHWKWSQSSRNAKKQAEKLKSRENQKMMMLVCVMVQLMIFVMLCVIMCVLLLCLMMRNDWFYAIWGFW